MIKNSRIAFFVSLCVCVFASQLVLNAQANSKTTNSVDYNHSKFKSEFEKGFGFEDISNLNDTPSNLNQVFFKTELPEWIFDLPHSTDSIIYAVGVSDIGMSKDSAFKLAILRAKAICALLTNTKMNGLSDYYISEKDLKNGDIISSVYQEFNKIVSQLTINNKDFTIVEDTFTVNKEAIVLVSLNLGEQLSNDTTRIHCLAEVSSSQIKKNNKNSSTSRMELMASEQGDLNSHNNYFYYIIKKYNNKAKMLSNFSGVSISCNTNSMTYQSNDNFAETEEIDNLSCTLQNGLWHAFSSVLLQTLVLDFQDSDVNQSGLGDKSTHLSQEINRIHSQKEVSLRLRSLHIKNNNLLLETDFIIQDLKK